MFPNPSVSRKETLFLVYCFNSGHVNLSKLEIIDILGVNNSIVPRITKFKRMKPFSVKASILISNQAKNL